MYRAIPQTHSSETNMFAVMDLFLQIFRFYGLVQGIVSGGILQVTSVSHATTRGCHRDAVLCEPWILQKESTIWKKKEHWFARALPPSFGYARLDTHLPVLL